jgi:putative chitinase
MLTVDQLRIIVPACNEPKPWVHALNRAFELFQINTPARIAAFIAQCAHESQSFNRVAENLNYSVEGLMRTWPKRFPTVASTAGFVRDPRALANKVYGGRMGNNEPNDGYTYRGRGLIQLTGKANYTAATAALGLPLVSHPDYASISAVAAKVAGWFWQKNGLNELADQGDFETITRKINGGLTGYKDRLEFYERAKEVLE